MKKKLIASLLTLSMTVAMVAGCGSSASNESAPAEAGKEEAGAADAGAAEAPAQDSGDGEAVTLTIAARGGTHADVIEAAKGAFEKENNCTINVLALEAADLKQNVALDATNAEGAYDLVMVDDPVMPEFAEGGVLVDLTQLGYKDDDDFLKASIAVGKNPYGTGDTYALPFSGNVQLLFYNQSVLDSLGEKVPTSWEGVLDVATKAKANGTNGFVIRGQQGNPIVSDYLPVLWAYGGDVFDDNWNVLVDSAEAKQAMQMYLDLLEQGANYEKNDIVASVADGSSAMALGWPSWFISGEDAQAAYAAIPDKASDSATAHPTGEIGNWMMGVTANSTHQELAVKLLEYLTSAEVQKASVDIGCVPTRTSVSNDKDVIAKYPYLQQIAESTENSKVRPRTAKWSQVEEVYGAELSNIVSGTKDIDTGLADAKKAIEDVMAQP